MAACWEVVGGADKGGILVRTGQELSSPATAERLSTGAVVEQLALVGDRLHYKRIEGTGPQEGWVSIKISGKDLLVPKAKPAAAPAASGAAPAASPGDVVVGPGSGYRIRWAVNIEEWCPQGDADGAEFQFLLGLINEDADRAAVMRYKFLEDKKRALMSRLLVRQASASALKRTTFKGMEIKRTKGRKPFLASPLPPAEEAPNWNVNVSHEGAWVVAASEPLCVVGVDVAELRRHNKKGDPIDFHKSFKTNLTDAEWSEVNAAGADLDNQYEVFSRFWSAKESFVKARGDGLAFELGKAEFHWKPLPGFADGSGYEGRVTVEGKGAPLWRFVQHRMLCGDGKPHWTTVARGPLTEIIDANGDFTAVLRKKQGTFASAEWEDALMADDHEFQVLPVAALVPKDDMEAYVAAGGRRWP